MEVIRSRPVVFTQEELDNEEWRVVPNFSRYEVSNLGNIRIIKDKTKILNIILTYDGYHSYHAKDDLGITRNSLLHRLVGLAWMPNPENKETINHKDGNKLNNRVTNLEWSTRKENTNHAVDSGLWTNNCITYVKDITTGITTKHMSMQRAAKAIGCNLFSILPYMRKSPEYPIEGKYVITLDNEDDMYNINGSGKKNSKLSIYDCLTKAWKEYPSLTAASYYTGIGMFALSTYTTGKAGYYGGYVIAKSSLPEHLKLVPDTYVEDRRKLDTKVLVREVYTYYVYDYLTDTEHVFDSIDQIVKFINEQEPSSVTTTNGEISASLSRTKLYKKTMIIKGYGIQSSDNRLPWGKYGKASILASRNGFDKRSTVYELKDGDKTEYVFGSENLAIRLNIHHRFGNPRTTVQSYANNGKLEQLVSMSDNPNITIGVLE